MHRTASSLGFSFVLLLVGGSLAAQSTSWTGATSTAWNVAGNWTAGVPTAATLAIIAPAANQPSTVGIAGAVCGTLTVQAGATLTTSTLFPLTANASVACAGAMVGLLRMAGGGSIATSGTGHLGDVTLVNGAYTVTDATIDGNFVQLATAGAVSIQLCRVGGDVEFRGAGLVGLPGSLLDVQASVTVQCTAPVTAPPTTIKVRLAWTSDGTWQPASGTVFLTGQATSVIQAPGTVFHDVEAESLFGTSWHGDMAIAGTLRMRGDITVTGTQIDLTQRAVLTLDALLDGSSVTQLRLHNGVISAGVIDLPAAVLDADGDVTFFLSGRMNLNGGVHRVSNSFGMPGILSTQSGASWLFDGTGVITVAESNALADVNITGTYTIRDAHIGGNLVQAPGAGALAIVKCIVDGSCLFQGSAVVDSTGGLLDANGNVTWQTTAIVNTPPATIRCAGSWTSNGSFQPTSGLVEFDGIGPKNVNTPAFTWRNLRVAPPTSVLTNLPVLTNGFLDVQGQLTTTGNDVEAFGALTVSGSLSANSSTRIRGHAGLTVAGAVNATAARLDLDGSATIGGSVALGAGPHQVSGSLVVTGLLAMPAGQHLQLDGAGTIDVVASSPIPNVDFLGTNYNVQLLVVSEDLTHTSGTLLVRTCSVQRDGTFQGVGLGDLAGGLLSVRRNLALQLSATVTTPPATIRCGGSWTSTATFAPTSGLAIIDGAGVQTVAAAAPFFNFRIAAGSQGNLTAPLATIGSADLNGQANLPGASMQVGAALQVGTGANVSGPALTLITVVGAALIDGTMSAPLASLAMTGDVAVGPLGTLSIGAGPHAFAGGFDERGVLTVPPTADFHFNGQGAVFVSNPTMLPTVLFAGGTYKVQQLTVQGLIRHTAGRLSVGFLTGLGNAQFQGATVDGSVGDILDVAGNIVFATANVVVAPPDVIRCGGNWTSNPQFLPVSGRVEMVGVGPQTMTSTQLLVNSLTIGLNSQLTFSPADVILQQDLVVDGQATAPSNLLEVRRDLVVHPGGQLTLLPTSISSVFGSTLNAGAIGGGGTLRMVGTGSIAGAGSFGTVEIAATGVIAIGGAISLGGGLRLSAGTLRVPAGTQVHVAGNFLGTGGVLRGDPGGVLDANANLVLSGVIAHASGVPDIQCAGNWQSDSTFAPAGSTVTLDGTGSLGSSGGNLTLAHVVIGAGVRTLASDLTLTALDLSVAPGARMQPGARTMRLTAANVTIGGDFEIDAGGELILGAATAVTVSTGGKLALLGLVDALAAINGPVGGGYSVTVNGTIEAVNYSFAHMGPAGIRINAAATIAPAPRDLRGGVFAAADATPGSCLLHIDRSSPGQLRYVRFEDAGTASFNIRSTGAAPIGIVNDTGSFTGPTHESDGGNVVNWLPPEHTAVTSFAAHAAVHRTDLAVATSAEVDVAQFHMLRAVALAGPYLDVAGSPFLPAGSPTTGGTYSGSDFATVDTTRYFYRLEEELTHGLRRLLGSDFARPWPQHIGDVYFVGTNGGYPDIATAVAAAPAGGNVLVQSGIYPAFTLNKAVRIGPDGSGPVLIDTTFGKMVVRDIPVGAPDVTLLDLQIGNATSGFGMEILNCDNTIVLDRLQVSTTTGVVGLLVDDTAHIAIQNCSFSGDPGVRVDNASLCYVSRGTIDELVLAGSSAVTRCDVVPVSQTIGVGSSVAVVPGTMPSMQIPVAWPSDKPVAINLTMSPNSNYALFYSFGRDFFELSEVFPFIDMVLLIEQTQATLLSSGFAPAGVGGLNLAAPGDPASWGLSAPLQVFELQSSGLGRMSTSRSVVLVP